MGRAVAEHARRQGGIVPFVVELREWRTPCFRTEVVYSTPRQQPHRRAGPARPRRRPGSAGRGSPAPAGSAAPPPPARSPARVGDILGYARVSTHDQHPDAQRDRLMEAGALRVFTDIISGKRFDRPALAELIDHARPGDRLCIIRLDRLGRSLRELLETVDDLKARGIHLLSLEERLDTSSAAGELVFHVFGAIAHFERRLISERTRDGIAAARKRGRTPGRPPLDPDTVSAAQKLIEAGLSPARTAKQLGIGRATAYRIAKAER